MMSKYTTYRLDSVETFHKCFNTFKSRNGTGYWFRGQADKNWELLPSAGRVEYLLPDVIHANNRDLGRCFTWMQEACALTTLPSSFVECLAIAQHHGLATRLLDWTKNPLVACFFAISSEPEKDGAIYALESVSIKERAIPQMTRETLVEHKGIIGYQPKALNNRLISQMGLFTIHCPPNREIPSDASLFDQDTKIVSQFIISKELKQELRVMLDSYGVNESTLFPDLDGLAKYVNRETKEMIPNDVI